MKKVILLIIVLLFVVSCSVDIGPVDDWRSTELVDVSTNEVFYAPYYKSKK